MSKLKCAYICFPPEEPLPTRKEAEKRYNAKILYGLRKHKNEKTELALRMHSVSHSFASVIDVFAGLHPFDVSDAELIVFDDSIDELYFTLASSQLVTKFSVDDKIIDEMSKLAWKSRQLESDCYRLANGLNSLTFYQQHDIGDQQFFDHFPKFSADLKEYGREVLRVMDLYKIELKSLFSNGW